MTEIIKFYKGQIPTDSGIFIYDIFNFDHSQLEKCHDYIQWMFPLTEKSFFNDKSPIVTNYDIEMFISDINLNATFKQSICKILNFYGFKIDNDEIILINPNKYKWWSTKFNHNFLRITRILKCMMLFGFDKYAVSFYTTVLNNIPINNETFLSFLYWENAIGDYNNE